MPSRSRSRRRGQSAVEFALSFIVFVVLLLGFGQIAFAIWVKTTLHAAVTEGVRYGITGQTVDSSTGHDASIRQAVIKRSVGLIKASQAADLIKLEFYDYNGNVATTPANAGGNTLVVRVANFPVPVLAALPVTRLSPMKVNVAAVGRLEPYPFPPPR